MRSQNIMTTRMNHLFLPKRALLAALTLLFTAFVFARDYTSLVDTRTGTNSRFEFSRGNTYPATGRPFAMHLWSPQTGVDGNGWKYTYPAKEMRGFALSHQCSAWTGDYASFSLFPEVGKVVCPSSLRGARFNHEDEVARPHFYSVKFRNGITTEMAPTERCCSFRFSFPRGEDAYLLLDLLINRGEISFSEDGRSLTGCLKTNQFGCRGLHNFFVLEFSQPFFKPDTWKASKESGAVVRFKPGSTVEVKVGTSYISLDQAKLNLQREIGDRHFSQVRNEGRKVWNELLGRIDVEGTDAEQIRTFYGCLFRANLFSRKFYELDADNAPYYHSPYDNQVHHGYMFTDNGFWDSFRSQFPLTILLHPTQQGRYMNAMLDAYDQSGWLPSWSFPGEQGGMLGNHAISLFADAWVKGVRTFDPKRVHDAYVHEVTNKGPRSNSNGRAGFNDYWEIGYVPYPENTYGSAMTLEYAYDDFCGQLFARLSGDGEWEKRFGESMFYYRNVFSSEVGFMRGRDRQGNWTPDFRPGAWGGPFIEGNAWHYNWSVMHDVEGLIRLYGSDAAFVCKLDSVFSTLPIIDFGFYGEVYNEMVEMVVSDMGQYEHGNQPIQHAPYLYTYAGQPWKTQYWVREIMRKLYNTSPDGYPGDEDQGAMSAWYVLSALGLYAVTPGTPQYVLGSPLFSKMTLTLEDGKKFVVTADGNSEENVYIQQATINGKPLDKNWITYQDITQGGSLHFVMGPEPNTSRGTSKVAAPFSVSWGEK